MISYKDIKLQLLGLCLIFVYDLSAQNNTNILNTMQEELNRNIELLSLPDFEKPFYINYTYGEYRKVDIQAVLGNIIHSVYTPPKALGAIRMLVGDNKLTNEVNYGTNMLSIAMPQDQDPNLIRRNFWMASDAAYKYALGYYVQKKAFLENNPRHNELSGVGDFTSIKATKLMVKNDNSYIIDQANWEQRLRDLSGIFVSFPDLYNTKVSLVGMDYTFYQTSSEGGVASMPMSYIKIKCEATIRLSSGKEIKDNIEILAEQPSGLPSSEHIESQLKEFATTMMNLKSSKTLPDIYYGPIMFEDGALMQILGATFLSPNTLLAKRPNEGDPMPRNFEQRVGQPIIDTRISIKNYTSMKDYKGEQLMGAYSIDAEGVIPEKELTLIDKGVLKGILNGRVPTPKARKSTGSSRYLFDETSINFMTAPGIIHVAANGTTKATSMKNILIKMAKSKGLAYAYIVKEIKSGYAHIVQVNVKSGEEENIIDGTISPPSLDHFRQLVAISQQEQVINSLLGNSVLTSYIIPKSMIIDNMEIQAVQKNKVENPVLKYPLQRN